MNNGNETTSSETPTQETETSTTVETTTETESLAGAKSEETTTDKSLVGEKPEETTEAAAPEPIVVDDLQLPEGMEIAEPIRDKFLELLNDNSLSPKDRANALLNLQKEAFTEQETASQNAWSTMQDEWQNEVKADPEFADGKLQPALTNISKIIDEYGSDELRAVFDLTGAGNNIHVVKFLNNVSKKLTEGGPISGAPLTSEANVLDKMYPSMKGQ